jgi:hypothetical protein
MDLSAMVADPAFGATLAQRLRTLADCGVLVQKEEQWDHRYYQGAYEWCTGTGPRAILVKQPQLVVTFAPGKADLGGALPPPADIAALSKQGGPTAVMPDRAALLALDQQRSVKPAWMPDWQWARVQELIRMDNPERIGEPFWFQFVPDYIIGRVAGAAGGNKKKAEWGGFRAPPEAVFAAWVDQLIGPAGARLGRFRERPRDERVVRLWRHPARSGAGCDQALLDGLAGARPRHRPADQDARSAAPRWRPGPIRKRWRASRTDAWCWHASRTRPWCAASSVRSRFARTSPRL